MTVLPHTNASRKATFGAFRWQLDPQPGNPEHIRITGGWAEANISFVRIPQLTDAHGGHGRLVLLHVKAHQPFLDFFADLEASGLMPLVHRFNGSWVPRFKRQPGTVEARIARCRTLGEAALSNHCWGTAIDLNAAEWPLGAPVPADAPWRLVGACARRHGIMPGMDFRSRPDGMHFELGRVVQG